MYRKLFYAAGLLFVFLVACEEDNDNNGNEIPDFNFPSSIAFQDSLSSYEIFQGASYDLVPSDGFHLLELSSILFTDYAHKQRLIKLPQGSQLVNLDNAQLDYPDGTMLVKTFFYYHDERDTSLGKRVLETRLLIKENGIWNVATYVWNQDQSEAILDLNGSNTQIAWLDENGNNRSTLYHIPSENECGACHQSNSKLKPIGPTLRNLNRDVVRNGIGQNQLSYFQSLGILNNFPVNAIDEIVDYNDPNATLALRARAYLAMNCSHCHNPSGWERPAETEFDFRYEISVSQTGIPYETNDIREVLNEGEMPFIGTTLKDEEGVNLVLNYLDQF